MRIPVLALSDPLLLEHQPGRGHPESPLRLARTLEYLDQHRLTGVEIRRPRPATNEEVRRVHGSELVEALNAFAGGAAVIDADTYVSPRTRDAAFPPPARRVGAVRR